MVRQVIKKKKWLSISLKCSLSIDVFSLQSSHYFISKYCLLAVRGSIMGHIYTIGYAILMYYSLHTYHANYSLLSTTFRNEKFLFLFWGFYDVRCVSEILSSSRKMACVGGLLSGLLNHDNELYPPSCQMLQIKYHGRPECVCKTLSQQKQGVAIAG